MPKVTSDFHPSMMNHQQADRKESQHGTRPLSVVPMGMTLSVFLSVSYVLCVLFDLWLPAYAMNPAWSALLPGFVWISWGSFFLGLIETFAYGWYAALLFTMLHNFFYKPKLNSHDL